MDNPNQVPVEAAGATAAQGQTEVVTHPTTPEAGSSATMPTGVEGSDNSTPSWSSDPRFAGKSPEDVYKSYRELETKLGNHKAIEEKAQLADLLQERLGITPNEVQDYIARQEQEEAEQRQREIEENPGLAALQEVESLKDRLALEQEKASLGSFIGAHPELAPMKAQLFKLALTAERNSNLSYEGIYEKYYGEAMKIAGAQAYQKIGEKQQMASTTPSSADVQKPKLEDLSVAEMEKILPHAN